MEYHEEQGNHKGEWKTLRTTVSKVQQKRGKTIKENGKTPISDEDGNDENDDNDDDDRKDDDDDDINDDTKRTSERPSPDPKVQQTVFGSVKVK